MKQYSPNKYPSGQFVVVYTENQRLWSHTYMFNDETLMRYDDRNEVFYPASNEDIDTLNEILEDFNGTVFVA